MAEIFTPATQPLWQSGRVAEWLLQPLCHIGWVAEWLLHKAGPCKQLLCTVCEWQSMEAWPLPVPPAARSWRTSRRTTYGRRRPTRIAESCRQSGSRSGRKWGRVVYHCQAANLDCILVLPDRRLRRCLQSWPRGRDFGLFGQLPVHLVYNFSFQAHIVRVEDNLLKQHLYIYIYIHTHTYILVMYRPKLHAQSRPKGHVIHQGAGVAEWRCTGYCSFTSSSGSDVHRPSERHR